MQLCVLCVWRNVHRRQKHQIPKAKRKLHLYFSSPGRRREKKNDQNKDKEYASMHTERERESDGRNKYLNDADDYERLKAATEASGDCEARITFSACYPFNIINTKDVSGAEHKNDSRRKNESKMRGGREGERGEKWRQSACTECVNRKAIWKRHTAIILEMQHLRPQPELAIHYVSYFCLCCFCSVSFILFRVRWMPDICAREEENKTNSRTDDRNFRRNINRTRINAYRIYIYIYVYALNRN